jgi:hypothetical protein
MKNPKKNLTYTYNATEEKLEISVKISIFCRDQLICLFTTSNSATAVQDVRTYLPTLVHRTDIATYPCKRPWSQPGQRGLNDVTGDTDLYDI